MMLFVKKLDPSATLPTCAHPGEDLAYDLYALEDVLLIPGKLTKVRTGIAVEHRHTELVQNILGIYYSHVADGLLIRDRSSMASRGIMTSGGVVDAGYRGEVIVLLTQTGGFPYQIEAGNKIAQMIPIPVLTKEGVMQIESFTEEITSRGANGFGSTGR
jgi:dUTP pyrophosphatase